jgi:hypothetical protein
MFEQVIRCNLVWDSLRSIRLQYSHQIKLFIFYLLFEQKRVEVHVKNNQWITWVKTKKYFIAVLHFSQRKVFSDW